jgi:hypothetical protein
LNVATPDGLELAICKTPNAISGSPAMIPPAAVL